MSGEGPAGGIDWAEVRRRLEKAGSAADRAPAPGEKKSILRKRALALAKEPEAPDSGEHIDVLEFLLARERYAVESSYVREVWPLKDLTPVPCTPPFVLGIIGVRGRILSVLDLKKFLNLPEKGLGDLNKVVILQSDTMEFGILADEIFGIGSVPLKGMQRSVPTLAGAGEEYLKGVAGDRLILLDAGRILSDRRILVNEEIGL
ncbi:MAG: chemotaxis protein CheW [Nitrospiraceae bacterium]|nr:chemotaxis protein CheW [Nitrospiraceae bacterium]